MTTAWDDLSAENAWLRKELAAQAAAHSASVLEIQVRMLKLKEATAALVCPCDGHTLGCLCNCWACKARAIALADLEGGG